MILKPNAGGAQVLANLKKAELSVMLQIRQNLLTAALLIQRKALIKTPVDTGNLRAGGDVELVGTPKHPVAYIYYTASYAVFVHEDLTMHHESGEAKFLENAVKELMPRLPRIIRKGVV